MSKWHIVVVVAIRAGATAALVVLTLAADQGLVDGELTELVLAVLRALSGS